MTQEHRRDAKPFWNPVEPRSTTRIQMHGHDLLRGAWWPESLPAVVCGHGVGSGGQGGISIAGVAIRFFA